MEEKHRPCTTSAPRPKYPFFTFSTKHWVCVYVIENITSHLPHRMETCPATTVVHVPRYRYEVERGGEVGLGLAEFAEHSVDRVEGSVDLLPHLIGDERCQCQHRYHTARALSTSPIQRHQGGNRIITFAPVRTILPDTKMRSTTLGLIIR